MVVLSGSNVNVGLLPSHLLFALFLSAQTTQPLLYLSRSWVIPFRLQHSGEYKYLYNKRHKNWDTDKARDP